MLRGLEDYIRKHRKKGFNHTEITSFLRKHGWHDLHISNALNVVKKEETQKFIAGAIWYILLIFVVTIGIMQVGKITGAATIDDVFCVSDTSGIGDLQYLTSEKVCCQMMTQTNCNRLQKPRLLTDLVGRAVYKADITCLGQNSMLLFNEAGYSKCL